MGKFGEALLYSYRMCYLYIDYSQAGLFLLACFSVYALPVFSLPVFVNLAFNSPNPPYCLLCFLVFFFVSFMI